MKQWIRWSQRFNSALGIGAVMLLTCAPLVFLGSATVAHGQEPSVSAQSGVTEVVLSGADHAKVRCWAFLAAALATGLGSIGAGFAVSNVGSAAMGAVAEKPELMGKSLIYVALAEGIAIYGLLISIIVLAKV